MATLDRNIDERLYDEIVRRLVEAVGPDEIILFGSRARGNARQDSDIDLLLIKDSSEPPHRRVIQAYRALVGLGVPKDILWRTPAEVQEWRVLYEKKH